MKIGLECRLVMDADVQAVAEFMQANVRASRLLAVSQWLAVLAPVLWSQYQPEPVIPLLLRASPCEPRTRSIASESNPAPGCADDGSVVATAALR
jgi:hypothetical protein